MKLKKLLKVIEPHQAIRLITTKGNVTKRSEVTRLDSIYFQPLFESLGDCKVELIRSVHDEVQLPDYQDILVIRLIGGGNDND